MKCANCENEFKIQLGARVNCSGCNVLTAMTTILTVQCEKCKAVFQLPLQSADVVKVEKGKKKVDDR